jgi:hypothetical protein
MNDQLPSSVPQPVPSRALWWQVYLPVAILVLLTLAGAVWVLLGGFAGSVDVGAGADVVLILLCLPNVLLGVLGFAFVAALCYGVAWLCIKLPPYVRQATHWLTLIERQTYQVSQRVAAPMVSVGARLAQLETFFQRGRSTQAQQKDTGLGGKQ